VAFVADPQASAWDELFVVDVSQPQPWIEHRVHAPLDSLRDVTNFSFSPDSRWLAMRGDLEVNLQDSIYVADVRGPIPGPPLRLNTSGSLIDVLTGAADLFWKRDGSGIFYSSDEGSDGVEEVWFVDLSGPAPAAPRRIHQTLPAGADVDMFLVQP
jgi:hypothetical protein